MAEIPKTLAHGVSRTAFIVVLARAVEARRPDRLVDDPYAARFLDAAGYGQDLASAASDGGSGFAVREAYFDTQLAAATAGGVRQVVMLAAGMDTRAYRMQWPAGTTFFEVDLPDSLDFKESVLAEIGATPGCEHRVVRADLREDWTSRLLAAGFRPEEPTAWLVQGLAFYLTEQENDRWLDTVTGLSASGSWLGFDHMNRALLESPLFEETRAKLIKMGAPWTSTREDPEDWLQLRNWKSEVAMMHEFAAAQDRPVPAWMWPTEKVDARFWLVTARYGQ